MNLLYLDDQGRAFRDRILTAMSEHSNNQLAEAQDRIKTLESAMRLFIDNIDRWLETDIPATSEESKAIYDACKKALSPDNKLKEDA